MSLQDHTEQLLAAVAHAAAIVYGERLVSLVVFGSVGRGTPRPDSDLDLLVIADSLPRGRIARVEEFGGVERSIVPILRHARAAGITTECSPVIKTRDEVLAGSPLFLDMIDDARVLFDRDGFFAGVREAWRSRLAALGARRIWRGNAWLWDLKPDYQPGDVFEL
jgi:predicted nucleotidyltransferase